ncbi:THAP domain-containing protein 1-like isoform X2 [Rhopalosiphum padi]|uniref:THAP domain-containing protein 1-like isoform X2 n=1 Tax=Rhopalosiphum padi TaxID=40932 RepID=UPI00298E96B5|nr:THAP domain-containing protein 1-like isoform X2 [Rhopalosiphum padi]XP_060844970.1 THAP domain-containing protein 1-like isoform X2 [Rhopalosiphum padi]XP_060847365.1 THAP domain-containing protein 1-like isoform X2 [Rhopalosiphum padi]
MVFKCSLKTCRESTQKTENLKMHGIPRSLCMMEKWVKAIQQHQPDFNATTHSKICSMHFLESDYTLSLVNNQKVLKKTAIPSVFMNFSSMIEVIEVYEDNNMVLNIESTSSMSPEFSSSTAQELTIDTQLFEKHLPSKPALDSTLKLSQNITKVNIANEKLPPPAVELTPAFITPPQPRKRKYYVGDFKSIDDLESPNSRRKLLYAAKKSSEKHVSTIKKLRVQNYSLQQKISNFEQLIDHLKNENKINENCFSFLKV